MKQLPSAEAVSSPVFKVQSTCGDDFKMLLGGFGAQRMKHISTKQPRARSLGTAQLLGPGLNFRL